MKPGDLVRFHAYPDQRGIFLGYAESNGYVYSEVLWFHGKVTGCQSDLLEKYSG